ncbi:LysR family transcriptional regulator [Caldimonas thermodepolymerans]|jgi:Transcriptional regulator|uniref:LysR family transcriptional regulator n=1 Tax=Caldimonas thermodepolymerans TaxID=215580 RepID=A0A2S5T3Y6_9BURK|nr:LysR family transcriptional regulator [Caldimonas thermodepolymerans]PPE69705.1 LysR family transcriptional regulator [Caldimonas thermodepolymerans]QPC31884.1 LysR family transcriptional regulator [Caldimonas thermodepolymerans]RDI01601.1 LysR family transcriptional regulator [Caldimonas thermodepolymerans]TCP04951.1 LysR family transcriptional regulator [Caldimonas thermodepolymerans]UZG48325.1 LysR family transcriptional regulator [Caldimonas thermodepolymerans]
MKDDRLVEMRIFKGVAETGGFTAAAVRLGVSQPVVSRAIASLEARLGCKLLHRSTRIQRLTQEGERYLALCTRVLDMLEQAEAEMRADDPVGTLHVSAPLAFGLDQVVPCLPGFLQAYPRLSVHVSLTDAVVNLIGSHVDVAIRMGRIHDGTLVSRKLCHLHRIIVASPAYLARHGTPVTPASLESGQHNCLLWDGMHKHLNRWPLRINGRIEHFEARGNFHTDNGSTLYQMCVAGMGIMRLAEHLALPALRRGELVEILADYNVRDDSSAIHAVYLHGNRNAPRVRAFVNHCVEYFANPPWLRDTPPPAAAGAAMSRAVVEVAST